MAVCLTAAKFKRRFERSDSQQQFDFFKFCKRFTVFLMKILEKRWFHRKKTRFDKSSFLQRSVKSWFHVKTELDRTRRGAKIERNLI